MFPRDPICSGLRRFWLQFVLCGFLVLPGGCGKERESPSESGKILWGTSSVGSSGHRALMTLATMLNRESDLYDITVRPMPGAVMTIRNYSSGNLDGFYGADVSFQELAENSGRFAGFRERMEREPIQSFWAYSMSMGVAIHERDRKNIKDWSDLSGKTVFTGPAPWDTRAHLERLFLELEINHEYQEVDLGLAGSQLHSGGVDAVGIYITGTRDMAPWVAEMELSTDIALLNPSPSQIERLEQAGYQRFTASPELFQTEIHVDGGHFFPFYYGFHLGEDIPEDDMYQILLIVEKNAEDLAAADPVFRQISQDMPGLQKEAVLRTVAYTKVHPGLARYMRERGVWDESWNDRIAELPSSVASPDQE